MRLNVMFPCIACLVKFFVEEKESVTNNHKQLTCVYGVNVLDKITVSRWDLRTASSERGPGEHRDASPWPLILDGGYVKG
jgi:hypothetical protein